MQFNYSLEYLSLTNIRTLGSGMEGGYPVGSEAFLLSEMPVTVHALTWARLSESDF